MIQKCLFNAAVLLCGGAMLTGCEVAGVILHVTVGDPPIQAQYVPPKQATLVMVENYANPDIARLDSDQIAHQVGEELKEHAKIDVVNPEKLEEMREDDPVKFREMKINAVGRAADAKTIIYVDLIESEVSADPSAGAMHAVATAHVRVIDATTGNTLWPADTMHGKELSQTMDYDQFDNSKMVAMHTQMLTKLSSKIAKLFYTWKAEDQDQENAGG